jgi:glutathione S-transferase
MRLYGCANSRSLRALWALEHAGAEYDYVSVDLFRGEGRLPAFLALNPGGKVPLLVDGGLRLSESFAIVTYVGEKFPESRLVPKTLAERGEYWRWCNFVVSEHASVSAAPRLPIGPDAGFADQLAVLRDVRTYRRGELLRGAADRLVAERAQPLQHVR